MPALPAGVRVGERSDDVGTGLGGVVTVTVELVAFRTYPLSR